jgi:hypothetical protein
MKKSFAFFALPGLLALAVVSPAQPVQTWTRFLDITVNTTNASGGANVATSVANFPLLVRLDSANAPALFSEALPGGADLRFADQNGNKIPHEIESWSGSRATVWVRVPAITGNGSTKVRMYWGRAGVSSESSPSSVFNASNGYEAVFHLGEAGGDTARDAVGGYKGIPTGTTLPTNVAVAGSVIGNAKNFNGTAADNNDSLLVGGAYRLETAAGGNTFNSFNYTGVNAAFTISTWVNFNAFPATVARRRGILTKADHGANTLDVNDPLTQWFLRPNLAARVVVFQRVATIGLGTIPYSVGSGTGDGGITGVLNNWNYVTYVANGSGTDDNVIRIYNQTSRGSKIIVDQDGPHVDADVFIGGFASNSGVGSGKSTGTHFFNGMIDEVRIASAPRTTDWVDLEYETQRPGATSVTYGAAQTNDTARVFLYPTRTASYFVSQAITANTPYVKTGTVTAASVLPSLPAGLNLSAAGVISGTPTAAAAQAQYVVTATIGGNPHLDTITITVSAGSPPGAPVNVTAIAATGQATVSWAAPASSGTTPITGYTVRAQDTTKTCAWTTGALSCVMTGLTNGTAYTFTVRAANSFGLGAASAPSVAVTPSGPPSAPLNVLVSQTPGGAASASVSWTAPASNGGSPITDYYVTAAPGGLLCYSPPVANPTCNVTGLTFGTAYTFTVLAANSSGNGPSSAPSSAFTPVGILGYTIQVAGASRPFVFPLTVQAMQSTDALKMTISDIHGRTIWTKTVNPKADRLRELRWEGINTTGHAVSAGVYMVRVSKVTGGVTSDFIQKAAEVH